MSTKAPAFLLGLLALTASGGLLTAGCGQTDSQVGVVHPVTGAPCDSTGARAPAGDGCNECTCESGAWACTTTPCTTACTPGAMKPADDGCNTCTCHEGGGWACTDIGCTQCEEGEVRQNDCNACGCVDGAWACTTIDCTPTAPCPPHLIQCGADGCVDPQTSVDHCGACNLVCTTQNATPTCLAGICVINTCEPEHADCNGDAADGCEVDTRSSQENCGACGALCVLNNASSTCGDGVCSLDSCNVGFADCDGQVVNGCETDVSKSVTNCGVCGIVCDNPHGTASCDEGMCTLLSCDVGFADCDADASNGCEVNTDSNVNNCGLCGNVCPTGSGVPICIDGVCPLD